MNYSKEFTEQLEAGQVLLRKVWVNENSSKNQVSAQFIQRVAVPTEGTSNALIAIAQGGSQIEDPGFNKVTAIFSFNGDVAEKLGLKPGDYFGDSNVKTAREIFGTAVTIKVTENTAKNPLSTSQTPKINPTTGEVLKSNGMDIYRHTELVEGEVAINTWLRATPVESTAEMATNNVELEAASQSI